jgi:hypothetical protein
MKTTQNLILKMLVSVIMAAVPFALSAQELETAVQALEPEVPEGYELVDSLVYRYVSGVDTTLTGKDIFHIMPLKARGDMADVEIYQSQDIANALRTQVASNPERTINGFRVRIFFDNKQSARQESEEVLKKFEALHRDIKAYRTYANPYFKVTVGDFRTKSEAMEVLSRIKAEFPTAFVVKESIEYPIVDRTNVYVVDTIKVLRPINIEL